jgi:uncharacterized protein (DUF305 family)
MTEQQLFQLKRKVEEAKTTVAELQGQQKAQMKQLSDEWGCKTLDDAIEKGKKMNTEIETLTGQIEKGIEELETKYEV